MFMSAEITPILAAAAGGILPSLAWLWFWLREDSKSPEPRRLIALAFAAGMLAVVVVIPIERYVAQFIVNNQTLTFAVWSAIEEITKFLAALIVVLWRRENDEPIDSIVYMVTVALGFAALENTLFLISPISGNTILQTVITGDLRFVGATLLHVLSSATIGSALAFSFYKPLMVRVQYAILGVILGSFLHVAFNFFILRTQPEDLMHTFLFVWVGVIVLLAVIEFVKRVKK
jgi:RsiW-degrading membrane proteinase PrsW (M82 family)